VTDKHRRKAIRKRTVSAMKRTANDRAIEKARKRSKQLMKKAEKAIDENLTIKERGD
jgi:hypothetical protein